MKFPLRKTRFTIALPLFRVFTAIILFIIILQGTTAIALFLFGITAFWSFFGPYLSKKPRSQVSSIVDLLADKLLVTLTAFALAIIGILPIWVLLVFFGRDLVTIIGASYLFYKDSKREFKPTLIGRVMFFFQIIALVPAILGSPDWVLLWFAIVLAILSSFELFFQSEFRKTKRPDLQEFSMTKLLKVADIFTLLNVIFGLAAIILATQRSFRAAAISLLLAVVADFIDGKVARKLNQQNAFGKELDSLADTISFGVAPAVFGFSLIQTTDNVNQPLAIVAFTVFLFCGILRLAKFNIMDKKEFQGMPITMSGLIVPLVHFLEVSAEFYPYIYLVMGILMISSFRIKKL